MRRALLVLAALGLTACGGTQEDGVRTAARAFGDALAASDGAAACALLAPLTREELEQSQGSACAQALPEQGLPPLAEVTGLQRYGRQASLELTGPEGETDTWFLTRSDRGWLVAAAGCRPRREDLPYSCDVEGP